VIDALGENGVRSDECIGEYHNSVYDLKVSDIQRDSDAGIESIINLDRPGLYDGDLVDVFLTLMSPVTNALQTFGPERELIFAIGEQEFVVKYNNELQQFNIPDVEYLSRLAYEDYLTMSLYQNSDSQNVLWEFGFVINGLHVYYKIPAIETPVKLEKIKGSDQRVRTLGGIRLKYAYHPPINTAIEKLTWTFQHDGFYCKQPGVDANKNTAAQQCKYVAAGKIFEQISSGTDIGDCNIFDCSIWWEPVDSAKATLWDDNLEIKDNNYVAVTSSTTLNNVNADSTQERDAKFDVVTRVLKPVSPDPMKGADVEMLEALLWQLGVSPQKGSPGSEGARINSDRGLNKAGVALGRTKACGNKNADKRNVFYPGWSSCTSSEVSLEAMVRRFQARNNGASALVFSTDINAQTGILDNSILPELKRDFELYIKSYESNQKSAIKQSDIEFTQWTNDAVKIWSNGSGASVPASYTDLIHNAVLQDAGLANAAFSRESLLKAWISEESPYHWGGNAKNYQATAYRMAEGGADEHGSLSFSQLLYGYRFGISACKAHTDTDLNPYAAADQVKIFTVHTAATANCLGGMNQAFVSNNLTRSYESVKNVGGDISDLVGVKGVTAALGAADDNYEKLAKAIFYYNSPHDWIKGLSWPYIMKYLTYKKDSDQNEKDPNNSNLGICHSCRYSIQVREKVFPELRTYIWAGERYPVGHAQAGDPVWCFVFGEQDWMDGKVFDEVKQEADDVDIAGKPQTPIGRVNCLTGVKI
jgi:hypothetical protein